MPQVAKLLIPLVVSYLFGAIPFGFIIARKVKGIDIRKFGSGNIGATNAVRVVGRNWGILVFFLDFLKGLLPVVATCLILTLEYRFIDRACILVAIAAIAGHNWPVYLKFRGGKGVSTSIGCTVALSIFFPFLRLPLLITLSVWVIVFLISRLVGLASLLCAFSFLGSCLFFEGISTEFKLLSFVVALFITIRHHRNIRDLLAMIKTRRLKDR
jgi:glycerol-3-phosphate acyltransferase PlsY